ncbi:unnamed protein product [Chilo suppressalis]|uniref:Zinc finger DNA binding protein n=1 Tax=Chilo suppressalis TaxID=168631 RepID=A0ABN8AWR4_CHISP|nr:unnamed protein product [Chilo suppressalis]
MSMKVQRSPIKPRSVQIRTGSLTDLTGCESAAPDVMMMRKRKEPDSNHVQKGDFDEFKKEIMSFLHDLRKSNDELLHNVRAEISEMKSKVTSVTSIINNLSQQHSKFKLELAELTKSMDFHTKSFDDIREQSKVLSRDVAYLKNMDQDIEACRLRLSQIERDLNIQQQRERLHNLEIVGFMENKNENLTECFLSMRKALDAPVVKEDLNIHRVPSKISDKKYPKNIIVKMRNQLTKDFIISAVHRKKGLTSDDLSLTTSDPWRIYINEHLTPFYKMLHKKTRETAAGANCMSRYAMEKSSFEKMTQRLN